MIGTVPKPDTLILEVRLHLHHEEGARGLLSILSWKTPLVPTSVVGPCPIAGFAALSFRLATCARSPLRRCRL
jgi:hypothetical protein